MSANSSSSSSLHVYLAFCINPETNAIIVSLLIAYVFMLPLFVFVFVLGFQKCRKQCLAFSTLSHIDVFTYNVVVLDLLGVLGMWFYYFGVITNQNDAMKAGDGMFCILAPVQMLFHLITCVERYLAVVHPIFYLHLRGTRGVRIRNITIGCVWLVSFGVMALIMWFGVSFTMITGFLLFITSVAFCFCSVSVLCVLIRPGPGEGDRNKERADQSKQRAFHTMMIITGTLSLRFLSNLIICVIQSLNTPDGYLKCLVGWSSMWFYVPSSLVLPLLFLQREGRLPDCRPKSDESA